MNELQVDEGTEQMRSEEPGPDRSKLDYFFNPKSIAIVGASDRRSKPGGRPLAALRERGYGGKIFPINPRYTEIDGLPCYASVLDVSDEIDMAIISVPAKLVLEVMHQCAEKGVKAAVIFTAGFSEAGEDGEALQAALRDLARRTGVRILGPNCLGLMNLTNSVMASFAFVLDLEPVEPKTLGFVSQSGAFGAMMYADATEAGVGFTSFTSVGNEADLEFSDFVEYLLDDPETQIIGGYLEGAKNGDKLRRVAERALELKKPLLFMKVGRTGAGARAAASHTGSLAGDDAVYEAFFRQLGIIRIEDLDELTAFAILHRSERSFGRGRVAILSGSGGRGVMLADKCESLGLSVPEITGATRARLEEHLPAFGSARNPVDMTAQAGGDPGMPLRCLRALLEDENTDVVLTDAPFHHGDGMKLARELVEIYESTTKPLVLMWRRRHNFKELEAPLELVKGAGIPILSDGIEAAKAIANLSWYERKANEGRRLDSTPDPTRVARHAEVDALLRGGEPLAEVDCKRILEQAGIPVTREGLATSPDAAVELARDLGYPVALKVQSGQILHKTEAGAIALGLGSDAEVREAYDQVVANARRFAPQAEVQGVLVQEMLEGGTEVIVGTTKDPVFGPVVMFGLGGIFVEALRDVSFRIAPLTRRDAEEMIQEIRGSRVLEGMRGRPPADREALIDVILAVSRLVTDRRDEIEELDVNPLVLFEKGAKAVDALISKTPR
jgi:acetyltransferase